MTKSKSIRAKRPSNPAITIATDERTLRALVRDSIRAWGAMNRYEERTIEDEFMRRAKKHERAPVSPENQTRAVALLDVLIAKADSPDYSDVAVLRKVVRRYALQSRELLSEVSP